MKHTSIIALHLPEHRILYTGLSRSAARAATTKARIAGHDVISAAAPVTGSKRTLWHYTVIATGEAV